MPAQAMRHPDRTRSPWRACLAAGLAALTAMAMAVALGLTPGAHTATAQMMGPGGMGGGMGPGGMMGGGMGPGGMGPGGMRSPVPATPESLANGRALFGQSCVACHGADARGDGPAAAAFNPPPANLRLSVRTRPPGWLFRVVTYGFNRMPPFGSSLSDTQRWDLINYLESLGP
jgi:mono/diheme cytochrome c family protein